jgi:hypothetical protein
MRDRQEATKEERTERVPFGVPRRKMNIDANTLKRLNGRVPRWINDVENRISEAQSGGYEFVEGEVRLGDAKTLADADRRIKKQVGTNKNGSPRFAFLMAIKKEFYEEDQAKKEQQNMMVDTAIKGGNPTGLNHHGVSPSAGGAYVKNIEYQP